MAARMTYESVIVAARRTLLDALDALGDHRAGLVLVGAQAIYLYTSDADVAVATVTKDTDVAVIPGLIASSPTLDAAMDAGGFRHDRTAHQPGEWASVGGGTAGGAARARRAARRGRSAWCAHPAAFEARGTRRHWPRGGRGQSSRDDDRLAGA